MADFPTSWVLSISWPIRMVDKNTCDMNFGYNLRQSLKNYYKTWHIFEHSFVHLAVGSFFQSLFQQFLWLIDSRTNNPLITKQNGTKRKDNETWEHILDMWLWFFLDRLPLHWNDENDFYKTELLLARQHLRIPIKKSIINNLWRTSLRFNQVLLKLRRNETKKKYKNHISTTTTTSNLCPSEAS